MAATHLAPIHQVGVVDVSRPAQPWRMSTALMDGVWIVGVAFSVPAAILIIGTPIALAIVAMLWAGRSVFGAF